MPGVPGQRSGPPPKRSEHRRRQNVDPFGGITRAPGAAEVPVPEPYSDWHPLAKQLFEATARSGEVQFYEPSDWAVLMIVCENISRELKPLILLDEDGYAVKDKNGDPITRKLPIKGTSLSAYLKAAQSLLLTEGDRRRLRVELVRPQPDQNEGDDDRPANVLDLSSRLANG